jgi:hypothetical protein
MSLMAVILMTVTSALWRGEAGPNWDADGWFAPHYVYLSDHIRAGRLALWNPWTEGGVPTCAEPSAAAFSPIVLAFAWLTGPSLHGFIICWLSIWFLAGVGMYLLSRHLGAPAWGAFAVAMGYLFSGLMTGHAEHISIIHSFVALPFVLWRLDAALRQKRALPAIEAGMILGLSALSGYPTVVLATVGLSALWVLGRLLCGDPLAPYSPPHSREPTANRRGRLGQAISSLILMAGVCAIVLSPTYVAFRKEATGHSDRARYVSREECVEHNALTPRSLGTIFSPYIQVVALVNYPHWCRSDPVGLSVYTGAVCLWLALIGLLADPRDRWRWWLAGIVLVGLVLAMGRTFPVRGWIYDLLPPTRYFRHTVVFRCYSVIALCALAALATRDIQLRRLRSWCLDSGAIVILSATVALIAITAHWAEMSRNAEVGPGRPLGDVHVLAVWGGVVLLGLLVTLGTRDSWASRALPVILCVVAAADGFFTGRLTRPFYSHRDPVVLNQWKDLQSKHTPDVEGVGGPRQPPTHGLSFKTLLTKTPTTLLTGFNTLKNRFCVAWTKDPLLLQVALRERVLFSPNAVETPVSDAAFEAFQQRTKALGRPPLLIHSREGVQHPPGAIALAPELANRIQQTPATQALPVEFLRYTGAQVTMRVECPNEGWLVFLDRWAAGWRASVNGQEQPILGGMFLYRALRVPAGVAEIRFWYRPYGYPLLLIASWLTIAVVSVCSVVSLVTRPHTFHGQEESPMPSHVVTPTEVNLIGPILQRACWSDMATRAELQERFGVNVLPVNFYSNTPSVKDIQQSYEYADEGRAPYLDPRMFDTHTLLETLKALREYSSEFAPDVEGDEEHCQKYFWKNGQFSYSDAMSYYCFLRAFPPKTVVEIGSGFSTLVAIDAVRRNGFGRIICVEPYPRPFLVNNPQIELVKTKAEELTAETVNGWLEDGDVLFIDSTHTVKTGSDCLNIYLRLIPNLNRLLRIHAHDIFLPFGLRQDWQLERQIFWTEQYLLAALLTDNPRAKVLYGSKYHHAFNPQLLAEMMHGRYGSGGGSFWFEYNGRLNPRSGTGAA